MISTWGPPSLHLLPTSPEEACSGHNFTLLCLVKDFYPSVITVRWQRGHQAPEPATEGPTCDHLAQRCSLVATLEVPWGEWVGGTPYACVVAHSSTDEPTEKRVAIEDGRVATKGC
uniref:Ig-like domain-containing protein n=1 Tax=Calidris pygmaea TaxID=425635 RepID=A0A8C3JI74_9CHAR